MSTVVRDVTPSDAPSSPQPAASVIRSTPFLAQGHQGVDWIALLPAWIVSALFHALFLAGFWFILSSSDPSAAEAGSTTGDFIETSITRETPSDDEDLTNTDEGIKPKIAANNPSPRIEQVTVPGPTDPLMAPGTRGDLPLPPSVSPPPGFDKIQGGPVLPASFEPGPGVPSVPGGMDPLRMAPGSFGGRSAATRQMMLESGGGNKESELAVARALEWLALHQARDGSWSLEAFDQHAHDAQGREFHCSCEGSGIHNNIAATAFGLLPFLGAGLTPQSKGEEQRNYAKNIDAGLRYLMRMQKPDGAFVVRSRPEDRRSQSFMYAHALATIVMCEAASLSPTQEIRESAQRALHFLCQAQHAAGGWRYHRAQPGDMSVTGWVIMALQSGRMAGLAVPSDVLEKALKFLDAVQYEDGGGYGYLSRPASENAIAKDPAMTAAGLLCREYLGWGPRHEGLLKGVQRLSQMPPDAGKPMNIYYYYYATQVTHHMGGDSWKAWNEKMRDLLIAKQDKGLSNPHQRGSWSPAGDVWGAAGGRVMETSLACLTLEVYYRHLPLYRQELGGK
jgi:hypothetical protein